MAEEDALMVRAKRSTRQANTPQNEVDENSLVNRFRSTSFASSSSSFSLNGINILSDIQAWARHMLRLS